MKRQAIIPRFGYIAIESKPAFARGFTYDSHNFRSTKTGLDLCASARLYALAAHVGMPAGLGLRVIGPGAIGGQADVIEIHPHFCERSMGPKATPPAAADSQRPPAGHRPGLAGPPAHDGQRVRRREPHDPRERPERRSSEW